MSNPPGILYAGETIMPWEKVPPENEAWLARMIADYLDAEKRKMFGCPVYFIGGNMWVGAHEGNFILRLPPADQEEILQHPAVTHFMPMGRPMREYVLIPPEAYRDEDWFNGWLQRSAVYVRTLPPPVKRERGHTAPRAKAE